MRIFNLRNKKKVSRITREGLDILRCGEEYYKAIANRSIQKNTIKELGQLDKSASKLVMEGSKDTGSARHSRVLNALRNIVNRNKEKNVIINDIGIGMKSEFHPLKLDSELKTFEPYEISNMILQSNKNPNIFAYSLRKETVNELNKKTLPVDIDTTFDAEHKEKIKNSVQFGKMDIITATPIRKADVTLCLNVLLYLRKPQAKVAIRNMTDSTKTGGHIITDTKLLPQELKILGLSQHFRIIKEKSRYKWKDETVYIYKKLK